MACAHYLSRYPGTILFLAARFGSDEHCVAAGVLVVDLATHFYPFPRFFLGLFSGCGWYKPGLDIVFYALFTVQGRSQWGGYEELKMRCFDLSPEQSFGLFRRRRRWESSVWYDNDMMFLDLCEWWGWIFNSSTPVIYTYLLFKAEEMWDFNIPFEVDWHWR